MVDTAALEAAAERRGGSSPSTGTNSKIPMKTYQQFKEEQSAQDQRRDKADALANRDPMGGTVRVTENPSNQDTPWDVVFITNSSKDNPSKTKIVGSFKTRPEAVDFQREYADKYDYQKV